MNASALGKIEELEVSDKGYTKLVLCGPVPWKNRYLTFYVWHKAKLQNGDEPFKVDDTVSVEYRPGKFNRLVTLEPARVDACIVCYGLFELTPNSQKIDCGHCSVFDADRRERAPNKLKLIAITFKDCAFSRGCCLTFVDITDILYFAWTFETKQHFKQFGELEPLKMYNISGWILRHTDEGNVHIELTHVPDLCV